MVSVVVPNYCHSRYLKQRLDSVLAQTYTDFELIILDDASPDDGASQEIIEEYRSNPHVSYIVYNDQNSGSTFKQWHKGFELAKGEYIWIAESDDYCEQTFLEEVMACYEKFPQSVVVTSRSVSVDENSKEIYPRDHYSCSAVSYDGKTFIKEKLLCSNFYVTNASSVVFKKDVATSLPLIYMDYKASGDRLFWILMAERGDMTLLDLPLNYFRQHQNKVSPRRELDGTQCRENYRICQYMHNKGYVPFIYRCQEFVYYWSYMQGAHFASEDLRQELINLWFPSKLLYNKFTYSLAYRLVQFTIGKGLYL